MNLEEYEASLNGGNPEADISDVKLDRETEQFTAPDEPATPAEEPAKIVDEPATPEIKELPEAEPVKPEETPPDEPVKKTQTPEENAKFAEERRQRQAELRTKIEQETLDRLKESDPAYKTARLLEELYGMPIDQVHERINQSRIAKMAEEQNVPVERIQAEEAQKEQNAQTQLELAKLQFERWQERVGTESESIKKEYPNLSDEDLTQARDYMLNTLKNPNIPLSQVVHALHGQKITDHIRQAAKQEALAEFGGRAQAPLPPQGGKPPASVAITDEERYIMKQMNISEQDWIKYK